MSEAELHMIRARLRGGIINKARRGELEMRLPIGFAYDAEGHVRLDPIVVSKPAFVSCSVPSIGPALLLPP